jgi:hypothetical protein
MFGKNHSVELKPAFVHKKMVFRTGTLQLWNLLPQKTTHPKPDSAFFHPSFTAMNNKFFMVLLSGLAFMADDRTRGYFNRKPKGVAIFAIPFFVRTPAFERALEKPLYLPTQT